MRPGGCSGVPGSLKPASQKGKSVACQSLLLVTYYQGVLCAFFQDCLMEESDYRDQITSPVESEPSLKGNN